MPATSSFTDITRQVHVLKDFILSELKEKGHYHQEENYEFSKHLFATKLWFFRASSSNKKQFLLALLRNIKSAWALSLVLKSVWNCRPKDAVSSVTEHCVWSSYDQVPMDHDRTALPVRALVSVLKTDRDWFTTLDCEYQAKVMTELLSISGGPILWEILYKAQVIYEKYRDDLLLDIRDCMVVLPETPAQKVEKAALSPPEKPKTEQTARRRSSSNFFENSNHQIKQSTPGEALKQLQQHLTQWNSIIKSMKDSLKLEELEITFNDGTKKNIWKVNRVKPEAIETVDFVQLLPAAIGKRILSYLPQAQLGDVAHVNKYWTYLVDELKAESTARLKINTDIEKLKDLMLRHETSIGSIAHTDKTELTSTSTPFSEDSTSENKIPLKSSVKASNKSGVYSFKNVLQRKKLKSNHPPICKLADLTEKLDRRGAVDDNLRQWCENALRRYRAKKRDSRPISMRDSEGILILDDTHFPCPLMREALELPLNPPLHENVIKLTEPKKRRVNIMQNSSDMSVQKDTGTRMRKYSLWSKDFSRLYPAVKIQSYLSPV